MTYSQNISELRRQNKFVTRVQQGYNTEAAKFAAEASVEQGKLISQFTKQGAELMQEVHKQKQAALKTEGMAFEFENRDALDSWRKYSATDEAKEARARLEKTREILNQAEYDTQSRALDVIEARKAGVDPAIINNYKSMDPTAQRWIADARLKRLGDQYKPWLGSQFLRNDTELTYTDEDGKLVKFRINETNGSANRFQQRAAHKYLRSQYIHENGLANFTSEFRELSGLNSKISKADNEFDATMNKKADIQYSARESALAGHSLITVPSDDLDSIGTKAGTYLTVTASGSDVQGNVGMARAHEKLEKFLVNSMKSGEFVQEELDALQSAEVPEKIAKSLGLKKKDGKYPTFADTWPNRYGEQGSLEKELLKANTENAAEFQARRKLGATNLINDGIDELVKSKYNFEVYNRISKELKEKYPGQDTSRLEDVWNSGQPKAIKNDERIRKIVENASNGVINDFSTDNLAVRSNPKVKALIEAQKEFESSPDYKKDLKSIEFLQKTTADDRGLEAGTFRSVDGNIVDGMLQRYYRKELSKQIQLRNQDATAYDQAYPGQTPYNVALRLTADYWTLNGGGSGDTTKLFGMDTDGRFPMIAQQDRENISRAHNDETIRKDWYEHQVNINGNGNIDEALTSEEPWLEHGNPDAVVDSVAFLEERGSYPPQIYEAARHLDGKTPYEVLNARYKALHGKELHPKYAGYQETFITPLLPQQEIKKLRTQVDGYNKQVEAGSHIIQSLINKGFTPEQAQGELLRKGFGPIGEELSYGVDLQAGQLAMAFLADISDKFSVNALKDIKEEGSVTELAEQFKQALDEGETWNDMGFGDRGKETLSLLTGDYSFLLRK